MTLFDDLREISCPNTFSGTFIYTDCCADSHEDIHSYYVWAKPAQNINIFNMSETSGQPNRFNGTTDPSASIGNHLRVSVSVEASCTVLGLTRTSIDSIGFIQLNLMNAYLFAAAARTA